MRPGTVVAVAVAPLLLLVVLLARPAIDGDWENHPAHFWLVLGAAIAATALGFSVTTAARRRRDARLLLISFAFIVSAAFLGLHALATPGVLLGSNAGFELATPVGLVLAAFFAAGGVTRAGQRAGGRRPAGGAGGHRRARRARRGLGRRLARRAPAARRPARSPSSSTAGSSSSPRSAARSTGSPPSGSSASTGAGRSASCSPSRSRSSCWPRRWS